MEDVGKPKTEVMEDAGIPKTEVVADFIGKKVKYCEINGCNFTYTSNPEIVLHQLDEHVRTPEGLT